MSQPTSETLVVIALYPGVTQLDFTGPHQVLCRAPDVRVVTASLGGADISAEGLVFAGLADLAKVPRCDVLLVPGGFGCSEAMLDAAFMAEIDRLGSGARYLTSVCTGSLILGAAGFLAGKRAACHWAWRELLEPFGAIPSAQRVQRDGHVITGGGVTAGIDFALSLVAELCGAQAAQAIQLGLEYAPAPPFEAGRPELASPAVLAAVQARTGPMVAARSEAVRRAAARLKQTAAVA